MGHGLRRLGKMADGAFSEGTVFSLPAQEFYRIVRLIGGGNGMGTIVAGGAANPFVTGGIPV